MVENMLFQIIGWIAVLCISIQFVPQVFHTYKTKKVRDLAYGSLVIVVIGGLTGTVYAYSINDIIFMIANGCVFLCGISLLLAKIKYD